MKDFADIIGKFSLKGTVDNVRPLGNGLINDTYIVTTREADAPDYVLQRINHHVFRNVDALQDNIEKVTAHIRRELHAEGTADIDRKVLTFIPLKDGEKTYYYDGDSYWRMMVYIAGTHSCETVTPDSSRLAGEAFGRFQSMLVDIDADLVESIPDFHNMEFRLDELHRAVAADPVGRVARVRGLLERIEEHASEMCKAERLHREGRLPKRICHCDTKVNNMLFDDDGRVLCVIDLDTVMPSFVFSDFGDFLRTGASTLPEDDQDIENVEFRMDIFRAFTEGYLSAARDFLTDIEIENLPYAAALFPYMQAVRFLADYINGDTYYKTAYPEHNLVRARNQFKLLQSIEAHTPEMREFIARQLQ